MTSAFVAEVASGNGYVVVSLAGELDLAEAAGLRKVLDRVVTSTPRLVVIDTAALTFLDSSGIGILVAAHNAHEGAGGHFVIANLGESTGKPVRLTEVDTAIPVHWADPVVQPWASPEATVETILEALGLSDVTRAKLDVDAEPIG
jgi:stage II sporulation protein AA (anti-sigma F factor antagonist)